MKRITYSMLIACVAYCSTVFALSEIQEKAAERGVSSSLGIGVGSGLVKADQALMRSIVRTNQMKGVLTESIAEPFYLKNLLDEQWMSITPRNTPQGLDHIFIKTNAQGLPKSIIVGESKYNTSILGETLDGKQMSDSWIRPRLMKQAQIYNSVVNQREPIVCRQQHSIGADVVDVKLSDGKKVSFWRESHHEPWKFTGTEAQRATALKRAGQFGQFLEGAADGRINYRSRIFYMRPSGADLVLEVRDAQRIKEGEHLKIKNLPKLREKVFHNALNKQGVITDAAHDQMVKTLQKEFNMCEKEAIAEAAYWKNTATVRDAVVQEPYAYSAMKGTAAMTLVAGLVDVLVQYCYTNDIDWTQTGTNALLVGTGGAASYAMHYAYMKNVCGLRTLTHSFGGNAAAIRFGLGASAFMLVDTAYEIYQVARGKSKLFDAAKSIAVTGGMFLAIPVAQGAIVGIPSAVGGLAGTGTVISTLSGAAYSSASLAWLGGGSAALGGTVATGGALIVVIGGAYAVKWGWRHLRSIPQEIDFNLALIKEYKELLRQEDAQQQISASSPLSSTFPTN